MHIPTKENNSNSLTISDFELEEESIVLNGDDVGQLCPFSITLASAVFPEGSEGIGLLRLSTSSFARFTIRRSGECGGVTTVNGRGEGRGLFVGRLPI